MLGGVDICSLKEEKRKTFSKNSELYDVYVTKHNESELATRSLKGEWKEKQ